MTKNYNLYRDSLHGFEAACHSTSAAWMLIRNQCYECDKKIPMLDEIEEIRVLTDEEMKVVRKRQKNG